MMAGLARLSEGLVDLVVQGSKLTISPSFVAACEVIMGKMIINNDSSISDDAALVLVIDCVRAGRISNGGKQYCYASKYTIDGIPVMLTTTLNKNSDSFCLYDAT